MKCKSIVIALIAACTAFSACGPTDGNGGNNNDGNNNKTKGAPQVAEHDNVSCEKGGPGFACTVSGEITKDLTIPNASDIVWKLQGEVFVGDDKNETVLTIEPGVTLFAASGTGGDITFLTVRRNSKIMAEGTKDKPIVMTTALPDGERGRGKWGGVIINGNAPINTGKEAEGEGNTGKFGGDDPKDSSGTLKYVRVEFAGALITEEDELNGIAFQGVGSGTTVDYVQVHMNSDDGVEFFGGTVSAKHLVLTGIGDDSLDWTDGWQGNVQYMVAQQYEESAGRGIEADNLEDDNDAMPRSKPKLANLTIIGAKGNDEGILLRRGTGVNIYNAIITNAGAACLDIDDKATFTNAWDKSGSKFSGELTIDNSIINGCAKAFEDDDKGSPFSVKEWFEAGMNNQQADPKIKKPSDNKSPDYRIESGGPADSSGMKPKGGWFDKTEFIGAVGPSDDWTKGWTIHAQK